MFDEGQNTVTMHLPESIERLKTLKKADELATSKVSVETEAPFSLSDVEYEEGYDENTAHENSAGTPKYTESDAKGKLDEVLPRHYSVDLWNGSPILPNFENIKVDESDS